MNRLIDALCWIAGWSILAYGALWLLHAENCAAVTLAFWKCIP